MDQYSDKQSNVSRDNAMALILICLENLKIKNYSQKALELTFASMMPSHMKAMAGHQVKHMIF